LDQARFNLKKILFCTNFSESSHKAFTHALDLTKIYHAKLLILHVTPGLVYPEQLLYYLPSKKLEELKAFRKQEITQKIDTHYLQKMEEFRDYEILVREGAAAQEIIITAEEESVDIIILGIRGRKGIVKVLLGSTSEKIVKASSSPVLIARLQRKDSSSLRPRLAL
jgi:nucleotide-binding universal stress UspA family protein